MSECAFTIFDTAIGRCALMWRGGRVVGAALPEPPEAELRASLQRRFPGSAEADPPSSIRAAAEAVVRLLSGKAEDSSGFELEIEDLRHSTGPFSKKRGGFHAARRGPMVRSPPLSESRVPRAP